MAKKAVAACKKVTVRTFTRMVNATKLKLDILQLNGGQPVRGWSKKELEPQLKALQQRRRDEKAKIEASSSRKKNRTAKK